MKQEAPLRALDDGGIQLHDGRDRQQNGGEKDQMSLLHKWQKLALFMYRATAKPLQERNDFVPA
jgi:hypothetical protein